MMGGMATVGGVGDVTARVAEIQSRIESLTGAFAPARGFDLQSAGGTAPSCKLCPPN